MPVRAKYTRDQTAQLGHALYLKRIRRKVARQRKGRVVALDIDTGDFAVADTAHLAAEQLRAMRPAAQVWLERIGYRTLRTFGAWHRRETR